MIQTIQDNVFASVPQKKWSEIYNGQNLDPEKVLQFANLNKRDIAKLCQIKKESVRFENERMSTAVGERIHQIAQIVELAAQYFGGDPQRVKFWFQAANPLLGNISPRDMLRFGRYDKLLKFIMNSQSGNRIP